MATRSTSAAGRSRIARRKFTSDITALPSAPKDTPMPTIPTTVISRLPSCTGSGPPARNSAATGPNSGRERSSKAKVSARLRAGSRGARPGKSITPASRSKPMSWMARRTPVSGFRKETWAR